MLISTAYRTRRCRPTFSPKSWSPSTMTVHEVNYAKHRYAKKADPEEVNEIIQAMKKNGGFIKIERQESHCQIRSSCGTTIRAARFGPSSRISLAGTCNWPATGRLSQRT